MKAPPFPTGPDAYVACGTCGRRRHGYLYPFADKRRTRREFVECLPCKSAALNAADQ